MIFGSASTWVARAYDLYSHGLHVHMIFIHMGCTCDMSVYSTWVARAYEMLFAWVARAYDVLFSWAAQNAFHVNDYSRGCDIVHIDVLFT